MIEVERLCKYYEGKSPIHQFDYTFADQTKYIITGPSGCGKTTLLRLIAGLEDIDEGRVLKNGELIGKPGYQLEPFIRKIGFVFQEPTLWPHMTVKQNIRFGTKDQDSFGHIVEVMGLQQLLNQYPSEISGGEAKRVALARMMNHKWQHLLLDEPLANINDEMKHGILTYIKEYVKDHKTTLIYVTHSLQEAEILEGITISLGEQR